MTHQKLKGKFLSFYRSGWGFWLTLIICINGQCAKFLPYLLSRYYILLCLLIIIFTVICFVIVLLCCSGHLRMDCNLVICVRRQKMLPGQQSADYVLGQVSGSLFQKETAASVTPLSALFSSASPATVLVFQPPAEVSASTSPEVKKQKPAEVGGQPGLACKRKNKMQSKAEQRLEGRSVLVLHPPV